MSEIRMSSRYANVLLHLAIKKNVLDDLYNNMKLLRSVLLENKNFLLVLKNPFISSDKKKKVFDSIFLNKFNDLMFSFFDLLILRGREIYIFDIIENFLLKYNKYCLIKDVKIITTFKLSDSLKGKFKNVVKKITFCNKVNVIEYIDSSLIGGYILIIDDKKIDESIKNKLRILKLNFKN